MSPLHLSSLAAESGPDASTGLLLSLLILFGTAKLGEELFRRLHQPAVVGEILAGVVVGPQVLDLVQPNAVTTALSELGLLFLLFVVGLETRPVELARVGGDALAAAVGGVILPFALGYGAMLALGSSQATAMFVGAALVATSVGITAAVLGNLGVLEERPSRIILAAAIADDILGLLVLAVVSGVARAGTIDYTQMALTTLYAILFTVLVFAFAGRIMRRARPALDRLRLGESLYITGILLCLGLAVAAGHLSVAGIIGAFLAGVALSDVIEDARVHGEFQGLTGFLVPFFLAGIGMELNIHSLSRGDVLAVSVLVTFLAIAGKLIGCGVPLWRRGRRLALQVAAGMVPRGEVGIIVAQLGLALGALNDDMFAVVLFMAVATTIIAPPALVRLFAGPAQPT